MPDASLDPSILNSLRELEKPGENLVGEIVDLFISDVPRRLGRLSTAIATGDIKVVGEMAHSIKGSCGNIGAIALQSLCQTLETAAKADAAPDAAAQYDRIEAEFRVVREALRAYLAT
ncbi:MAG: Hpt domain-containing protein [Planctomycetota bacterium]